MKKAAWGRIVAVTSLSVMEPIANIAVSNAMRSATTAMLKTLADEVAQYNITINCVAPGVIATERQEEVFQNKQLGETRDDVLKHLLSSIPAKRLGTSEEMGDVITFLCSRQASYVTGSTICVDGGKRRSVY